MEAYPSLHLAYYESVSSVWYFKSEGTASFLLDVNTGSFHATH